MRAKAVHPIMPKLAGLGLSSAVAAASVALAWAVPKASPLLFALLLGLALYALASRTVYQAGLTFASKSVLRFGVAMLGARITAEQIMALGAATTAWVSLGVASTVLLSLWLAPRLRLARWQGVIAGGSVAICGASAALAMAAATPAHKDKNLYTVVVILTVTILSTVAMVLYPALARLLGLTDTQAAIFLGASIHDVAQVVGAGYLMSAAVGDTATIVKLFRVALLALVVLAVTLSFRRSITEQGDPDDNDDSGANTAAPPLIPLFLWGFLALVLINSLGLINPQTRAILTKTSSAALLIAIAALGLKTQFAQLASVGWRPFVLIVIATVWIAVLALTGALLFA